MTSLVYSTGTVSVSNASAIVTGTGTLWDTALVTGGGFSFAGMSVPIVSVESDTSLTLAYPWPGTTASGAYAIARETSEAVRAAWINDRMARLMTKPWGTGVVPDGRGTMAERDALSPMPTDKYCWLREETSFDPTLYFKTPSGWIGPYPLVGEQGPAGVGVGGYGLPAGGTTGQVPTKASGVDGAVAWADPTVPDNAITYAKMQNVSATARVLGRKTAGAGDPEELTLSDVLDMVGSAAQGDILYRGASGWARLPKGTAGQYLKQNTALTAPEWVTVTEREVLTANRTYYVRTDGSNSNNGLANTSGGAFLTIQKAIDTAAALDLSIYNVTIQVADGTYTGANLLKSYLGSGPISIIGNVTTPANVLISVTSNNCFFGNGVSGTYDLRGMKLQTTTSGTGIYASNGTTVTFRTIDFGACVGAHILAVGKSYVTAAGAYTISGGAGRHWWCETQSLIVAAAITITLTGTPAFGNQFALCYMASVIQCNGNTFTGSATGTRYDLNGNSVIFTNGGGASYLPGSVNGAAASGGQYV